MGKWYTQLRETLVLHASTSVARFATRHLETSLALPLDKQMPKVSPPYQSNIRAIPDWVESAPLDGSTSLIITSHGLNKTDIERSL